MFGRLKELSKKEFEVLEIDYFDTIEFLISESGPDEK